MHDVTLVVFHAAAAPDDPPLTRLLASARDELIRRQAGLFRRAGVRRVVVVAGRGSHPDRSGAGGRMAASLPPARAVDAGSFGEALAVVAGEESLGACIVLGSGAVPLLRLDDARRLVTVAGGDARRALSNNRYSSDVCAVAHAGVLRDLPALPSDNALPRWLEEVAGYAVEELPGRDRLGLDLDTPLDLALLALAPGFPAGLARLGAEHGIEVPRLEAIRGLAADPRRELLVFGRSSSRTLAWLERHVRCRVRFLAEERGLRASSPLAIGPSGDARADAAVERHPRATLGRLLAERGPDALPRVVGDLADGALLDSRVLLADRLGPDERSWPRPEDRFASDLLRPGDVADAWLRSLTAAAAGSSLPILLGGHTLVGPGIALVLRGIRQARALR